MIQEPTPPAPADDAFVVPSPDTGYNPDEYRWVPVRRRPRLDGWTEEKQRRFIEVLADTGLVNHAAKAVGMSRESAGRLRRSPHGAAFARAWEAARHHAGAALEDIAFERAIEGVEQSVFNEYGEVICTKRVYNDRLLAFLLRHLKPERYSRDAPPVDSVDDCLRAMEPQLPAPAETLLGAEVLEHELLIADLGDGVLPSFLSEQRKPMSTAREMADEIAVIEARVEASMGQAQRNEARERAAIIKRDRIKLPPDVDLKGGKGPSKKRFR